MKKQNLEITQKWSREDFLEEQSEEGGRKDNNYILYILRSKFLWSPKC